MSMPLRAEPCAFRHMNTIAGTTDELFDVAIVLAGTGQSIGGRNRKPMDDDAQATQDERAALADTTERTQRRSDRYEEAGLGPEIRSGAISGAEAERKARDPDAPKPPSRVQQLEMQPGQPLRAEDLGPLVEGKVGGHQDGAPLVALAEDLEEQLRPGGGQGDETQLVDDQQVQTGKLSL